jgi:hypothetical protein
MDLSDYMGKRVSYVRQIFYTHGHDIDRSDCQLELSMDDSSVLRLSGGTDGQSVVVSFTPWKDVFQEPLSEENREYVERHGKWSIFDTSNEERNREIVHSTITDFCDIVDEHDQRRGVRIHIGHEYLSYIVDSDEGFVSWGEEPRELGQLGLSMKLPPSPYDDGR